MIYTNDAVLIFFALGMYNGCCAKVPHHTSFGFKQQDNNQRSENKYNPFCVFPHWISQLQSGICFLLYWRDFRLSKYWLMGRRAGPTLKKPDWAV